MKINTQKGFTLIELLVVVAIIGMLSSVVLSSLNTARSSARDTRRLQDLKQLQTALELYQNTHGRYPVHVSGTQVDTSLQVLVTEGHIPSLPTDPANRTGQDGYRYCAASNRLSYNMLAYREQTANWCYVGALHGADNPCSWNGNASYTACGQAVSN